MDGSCRTFLCCFRQQIRLTVTTRKLTTTCPIPEHERRLNVLGIDFLSWSRSQNRNVRREEARFCPRVAVMDCFTNTNLQHRSLHTR